MKKLLVVLLVLGLVGLSQAVEKRVRGSYEDMYYQNLALSAQFGIGLPLGDFGDSQVGNAAVGGVGKFGVEYYFTESFSLGFDFSGGIFEDDDDPDFQSWVNNYQLFGRFLMPVEGKVRPYGKLGLGLSTLTQEIEDVGLVGSPIRGTFTFGSDPGLSLALEAGAVWRVSDLVALNGGLGYDVAFLNDAEVGNSDVIVGFDPNYFSINFGLSFFLKR